MDSAWRPSSRLVCPSRIKIPYKNPFQMKETKTANSGSNCPTLLHYLARVLLNKDPSLVLFIEDLNNVEPAARCKSTQNFWDSIV